MSRGARRYAALGAAIAVVALVAGILVIGGLKESAESTSAELAVSVSGVPDYVVLGKPFVVTIEYENRGDLASGPLALAARLPDNFWLESSEPPASVLGNSILWQLDSLEANGRGSVQATLNGKLPENLTGARYDYEGYEGYAAIDDGFELSARISVIGDPAVLGEAFAKADTGVPPLQCTATLTLVSVLPATDTNPVGTSHTVTAYVECNGPVGPQAGVSIDFLVISGPHTGAFANNVLTNPSGQASFTYPGTSTGTDTITAFCGACGEDEDTATKTWVQEDERPRPPTRTPTPTPRPTRTPRPTETPAPTVRPNVGGIFGAIVQSSPEPTATPMPAGVPAVIQAPRTGDAGLDAEASGPGLGLLLSIVALSVALGIGALRLAVRN